MFFNLFKSRESWVVLCVAYQRQPTVSLMYHPKAMSKRVAISMAKEYVCSLGRSPLLLTYQAVPLSKAREIGLSLFDCEKEIPITKEQAHFLNLPDWLISSSSFKEF